MQKKTYLQECLRNGKIIRWEESCMPLKVYISPFRFYSQKNEDYTYRKMAVDAFNEWERISCGVVSFQAVDSLLYSQINLEWKRVDRDALGHCVFNMDANNRLYSAEVQIGISDGLMHQEYMKKDEVYHTILHEVGHAVGLGHSTFKSDIMYTPHQYGITQLSEHDKLTLKWLYKFGINKTPQEIGYEKGIQSSDLDEIVLKLIQKNTPSEFENVKNSIKNQKKDLLEEQTSIADLKKYNLSLQNISISQDVLKHLSKPPYKKN